MGTFLQKARSQLDLIGGSHAGSDCYDNEDLEELLRAGYLHVLARLS
jgi:hypothetical protein